jgi:hypothetical protein
VLTEVLLDMYQKMREIFANLLVLGVRRDFFRYVNSVIKVSKDGKQCSSGSLRFGFGGKLSHNGSKLFTMSRF